MLKLRCLTQGSAGQKGTFFYVLLKKFLKTIIEQKKIGDRISFKYNTKTLLLCFRKY